jgi:hypothetical protein
MLEKAILFSCSAWFLRQVLFSVNWWFSVTFSWVLRAHLGCFCINVNAYTSVVMSTYLLYAFSRFGHSEILI